MDLAEILGEDYKEGMTAEDVSAVFEKRILNTGRYTNKDKADADSRASQKTIQELKDQLKGKMTDEELSKEKQKEFESKLQEALDANTLLKKQISQTTAEAQIAEAKSILDIKADDKDFQKFISNISSEDSAVTKETSSYVMKMVKDAYEKGKAEVTKQSLGEMGKVVVGKDGKVEVDKETQFVKNLVSSTMVAPKIKNSNFM